MAEDKKKFDLNKIHDKVQESIAASTCTEELTESDEQFQKTLDAYDRFLDTQQKELRRKPVTVKDIVADEDAVIATLKTYQAINNKIQQQIADGTELSSNDIKLLVSMMTALNGV